MADIFRWVDPDDASTVLLDMNSGFPGIKLRSNIDWGDIDKQVEWLSSPPTPGAIQVGGYYPVIKSSFQLRVEMATWADVETAFHTLGELLDSGGVIEYQDDSMSAPRYVDVYPSAIPALLRGKQYSTGLMKHFRDEGIPVDIDRFPFFRLTKTVAAAQDISNLVGERTFEVVNNGNVLSPMHLKVNPTGVVGQFRVARRSGLDETQRAEFKDFVQFQMEDCAFFNDTILDEGNDNDDGDSVTTDFEDVSDLVKRIRREFTATDSKSIEGRYKVLVRLGVKGEHDGGDFTQFRFQLHHGLIDEPRLSFSGEVYEIDFSDDETASGLNFVEIDMGEIRIPKGATFSALEFWAERLTDEDGDSFGKISWDSCTLMPIDEQMTSVSVPGLQAGGWSYRKFRGADLLPFGGAFAREDFVRLNATDEVAQVPPTNGQVLDAGKYIVKAKVTITQPDEEHWKIAHLEIVEQDTDTVRRKVRIYSQKSEKTTRTVIVHFEVTNTDVSDARKFKYRVKFTRTGFVVDDGWKVDVRRMSERFLRGIAAGEIINLNALKRESFVTQGGNPVFFLFPRGGPLMAPPGTSVWVTSLGDLPVYGYGHADVREALPDHVYNRGASVVSQVHEMVTH